VGVVDHPPVSTLDFPITNAPGAYPQRHNFGGQADEDDIAAEVAAATAAAAAAAAAAEASSAGTADIEQGGTASPKLKGQRARALFWRRMPAKEATDQGSSDATTIIAVSPSPAKAVSPPPMRHSASGVTLNLLDPAVAVKPRLTAASLLLRTLPIWLTVLVLLLTRIPALPIKSTLQRCVLLRREAVGVSWSTLLHWSASRRLCCLDRLCQTAPPPINSTPTPTPNTQHQANAIVHLVPRHLWQLWHQRLVGGAAQGHPVRTDGLLEV